MDFDYPFANLPSALVEPLPPVSPLLSYFNLSLSGWTSGVVARIRFDGGHARNQLSFHPVDPRRHHRIIDLIPKPHAKELRSVKGTRP